MVKRTFPDDAPARVMLLLKASSYRAPAFLAAAERLGVEVVQVIDTPQGLAQKGPNRLGVDFRDLEAATAEIVVFARERPVRAILPLDDSGALLAAEAGAALGLPHNRPEAAEAARDKYQMRSLLAAAGAPVPAFRRHTTAEDVRAIAREAPFPCVVKPLRRSGSQGVIRANDEEELVRAIGRLRRILEEGEAKDGPHPFLVEEYLPGEEVALEGVLDGGRLHVLALFDKPDPLEGPFFEETIYVTPSRLAEEAQAAIAACVQEAATAIGLQRGPIHAELRINERGPWLLEVAGRSIGGLCSRTLQFSVGTEGDVPSLSGASLEELILRQVAGLPLGSAQRERAARGVMMIPIPAGGLLRGVEGVTEAKAVPGIEEVEITARVNQEITPLPEGDSYLGFIFARGETPAEVEEALRAAHEKLRFEIEPVLRLRPAPPL